MKRTVRYVKLKENAKPPYHAHADDMGWDLAVSSVIFKDNGHKVEYGCGLAFDLSETGGAIAFSRSSVVNRDMMLMNGAGIIDPSYRGEVTGVFKTCENSSLYLPGERFMQLVFPYVGKDDEIEFVLVDSLEATSRGSGGYGSTGK